MSNDFSLPPSKPLSKPLHYTPAERGLSESRVIKPDNRVPQSDATKVGHLTATITSIEEATLKTDQITQDIGRDSVAAISAHNLDPSKVQQLLA